MENNLFQRMYLKMYSNTLIIPQFVARTPTDIKKLDNQNYRRKTEKMSFQALFITKKHRLDPLSIVLENIIIIRKKTTYELNFCQKNRFLSCRLTDSGPKTQFWIRWIIGGQIIGVILYFVRTKKKICCTYFLFEVCFKTKTCVRYYN